ncbi:MAG: phage tail assembly protein [Caldilineaceae bacterium]|nr:phage tail assembly protein [Caldilineaceae bacterium]
MGLQTEFNFTLPRGYIDAEGHIHRGGRMRLAQGIDEVVVCGDPQVQDNVAYAPLLLLSRVVVALGDLVVITPQVMGQLFAIDLAYLEDLYLRLNSPGGLTTTFFCPHCQNGFQARFQSFQSDT